MSGDDRSEGMPDLQHWQIRDGDGFNKLNIILVQDLVYLGRSLALEAFDQLQLNQVLLVVHFNKHYQHLEDLFPSHLKVFFGLDVVTIRETDCLSFRFKIWCMIPGNGKSNSDVLVKSQMLLLEAREDSSLNDKTIDSFDGNTFCILLMPGFNGDFQTSLQGNSTTKLQVCVEAMTSTGFHFVVTALVGLVSNATGHSASKHVPLWELLWFSIVANMSITGMN